MITVDRRSILFGVTLVMSNLLISFALAYVAAVTFNSSDFDVLMLKWRETGNYPYPRWVIYALPGLSVWPIQSEIMYQVSQAAVWGYCGYIARRYFNSMKPTRWIWVPVINHIVLLNPVQVIVGSMCYYFTAKDRKNIGSLQQ